MTIPTYYLNPIKKALNKCSEAIGAWQVNSVEGPLRLNIVMFSHEGNTFVLIFDC